VIKFFRSKETEQLHARQRVKRFRGFERVAQRNLRQLDIATELRDLASPPGHRLEALKGHRGASTAFASAISGASAVCGDVLLLVIHTLNVVRISITAKSRRLPPVHPGEILREDFMVPLGISMNKLALDLGVPVTRIAEIVHERRGITPDTALRLGRYFTTSARFWLNAQAAYDLEVAQDELQSAVQREVRPRARLAPSSKAAAKA